MQVFVVDSGNIRDQSFDDPTAVPDGTLAIFDVMTTDSLVIDSTVPANISKVPQLFHIVKGGETPLISSLLEKKKLRKVTKFAYQASSKQVTEVTIPAPTKDGVYTINVAHRSFDSDREMVTTASVPVTSGEAVESVVNKLVKDLSNRAFLGAGVKSNRTTTVTLTGTSGTANVVMGGTSYGATFNTSLTQTATDFVTARAAAILKTHGITVTSSGAVLTFAKTAGGGVMPVPVVNTLTGNLSGTVAAGVAATKVIVTGPDSAHPFTLAFADDLEGATVTTTSTASPGRNGFNEVAELERRAFAERGEYYVYQPLLGTLYDEFVPSAKPASQYTAYVIEHENNNDKNISRDNVVQHIYIFMAGVTGTLDSFFADYLITV